MRRWRGILAFGAPVGFLLATLATGLPAAGASGLAGQGSTALHNAARDHVATELLGDGIGGAKFGQQERVALANLESSLGKPASSRALGRAESCDVSKEVAWHAVTTYFVQGRFAGYATLSPTGWPDRSDSLRTAKGLTVGDTLLDARHVYGKALSTSYAQGGSWSAKTPAGTIDGFLSGEVDQLRPPVRILTIEAGYVGCPAMTP